MAQQTIIDDLLDLKQTHRIRYYALAIAAAVLIQSFVDSTIHVDSKGWWNLVIGFCLALVFDLWSTLYGVSREVLRSQERNLTGLEVITSDLKATSDQLRHQMEGAEYLKRILHDRDFRGPISNLMFRSESPHVRRYSGMNIRKEYLEDLKLFVDKTRKSYFTLQPGLPFFNDNYWFFRSFDDSLEDCVRVITHDSADGVAHDARSVDALQNYAYEAGKHTRTLWCLKLGAIKAIESLGQNHIAALSSIPFDLKSAIQRGDVVICDELHRRHREG
jgi:hypothetical protein